MTHTDLYKVQEVLLQERWAMDEPNDVVELMSIMAEALAPITCDCGPNLPPFEDGEARCPDCLLIHCIG